MALSDVQAAMQNLQLRAGRRVSNAAVETWACICWPQAGLETTAAANEKKVRRASNRHGREFGASRVRMT